MPGVLTLGASKESAKELKLFDLSGFLSSEYKQLFGELYDQNVSLAGRRLRRSQCSQEIRKRARAHPFMARSSHG